MKSFLSRVVRGDASKEQAKDTGMAIVLIALLYALIWSSAGGVVTAIGLHVVNMTAPQLFRPAAVVWFAFSHLLGTIVSRIVLILVFFLVVTPVAVARRFFAADTLRLRAFKVGGGSVMSVRNHTFSGKDIENPY
jgi:hypothetical protein